MAAFSRLVALAAGVFLLIAAFIEHDEKYFTIPAIVGGAVLTLFAGLFDKIAEVSVGPGGGTLKTHGPLDVEETTSAARAAEDQNSELRADPDEPMNSLRYLVADTAIQQLLEPSGFPSDSEVHLFVYDEDAERLLPVFETEESREAEGWEIGKGATGRAFELNQIVIARRQEAWDDTYDLTAEQSNRYRDLAAVVSVPVRNAAETVIAVLTASTTADDSDLTTDAGIDLLELLAGAVARILVDLLKWYTDEE